MRLFDTHAHLDDEQLRANRDHWLKEAQETGLVGINSIGTNLASSGECVALAESHPLIYASVGIHPNYCREARLDDWPLIEQLAHSPHVVGIGETGLDRYWDYCPIEIQRNWFARHIELSYQVRKPLVIHIRDAETEVVELLAAHQRDGHIFGILHSFACNWETAQKCLEWGMYISFSGIVTYKKSSELREIAKRIPVDRILIETDAPYLPPHPVRSARPNHPALIRHTAACLAELLQLDLIKFCELTSGNAFRAFGLSAS
jgi:TatD DNase family protein